MGEKEEGEGRGRGIGRERRKASRVKELREIYSSRGLGLGNL